MTSNAISGSVNRLELPHGTSTKSQLPYVAMFYRKVIEFWFKKCAKTVCGKDN